MDLLTTRRKLVPLAAAAVLAGAASAAMAVPMTFGNLTTGQITLSAEYQLPNGSATVDGLTTPGGQIYNTGNGADFYLYQTDNSGNNVFFHTYGDLNAPTYFGARASGEGSFYASTYARYSRTFTNNTLLDQIYNFAFNVSDGQLDITGVGQGFASLMLRITRTDSNGTTVLARDYTALSQSATNVRTCDDTQDVGTLGNYSSCANLGYFSGGGYNVNLGNLAAGESFTLDYDIIATVSGDLSMQNGYGYGGEMAFFGCGGGEIATLAVIEGGGQEQGCAAPFFFPGMAIARSGDPFNGPLSFTTGLSDFQSADITVSVPEPGSLALMGVALAGLAAHRRRRNQADAG